MVEEKYRSLLDHWWCVFQAKRGGKVDFRCMDPRGEKTHGPLPQFKPK